MVKMELKDCTEVKMMIAKKGDSLRSFSKDVGMSQAYLSQVLSGKYNPSPKIAFKIAKGLGVELEEIFLIKNIDITIKQ